MKNVDLNLFEIVLENSLLAFSNDDLSLNYEEGETAVMYYSDGSGYPGSPEVIEVFGTVDFVVNDEHINILEEMKGSSITHDDLEYIGKKFLQSKMDYKEFVNVFHNVNLENNLDIEVNEYDTYMEPKSFDIYDNNLFLTFNISSDQSKIPERF